MFVQLEPFPYYSVFTQTLNLSNVKNISISQPIFTHKIIKGSMGKLYPYSTKWGKHMLVIIDAYGVRAILVIFCDH